MAGARPGVHVVKLKPVHVAESLIAGNKFIKWDDDNSVGMPVTLRVDSKGYFLYWQDQNKEIDCLDLSMIRDTRTGRQARLPKDARLREAITVGTPDCPLEDKMLTVAYGVDMVNINYANFAAISHNVAREWATELFRYSTNLLALNGSPLQYLEKCWTKLSILANTSGQIPFKNVLKMFAQNKDDRKRVKQAVEAAGLTLFEKTDEIEHLTFDEFMSFYHKLCGRNEVRRVFNQLGAEKSGYLSAEQFMEFLNQEQRDPRLNEILYPYYDVRKSQTLIDVIEGRATTSAASVTGDQQLLLHDTSENRRHLSAEGFLRYLLSSDNAIVPPEKLDLNEDMTQPLSHYFINSSHNTYLTGHQLTGKSSVEIYRQVLLTGCRCIELDCWDGKGADEEPIITHGFTMCSEIVLKEVLEAIADSAFKVSDYPVILSFENHCSPRQQVKIASHCRNIFGEALLTEPIESFPLAPDVPLPSPEMLKRKILIKNKKINAPSIYVTLFNSTAMESTWLLMNYISVYYEPLEFNAAADATDTTLEDGDMDYEMPSYPEELLDYTDDEDKKRQANNEENKGMAVEEAEANMEMSSLVIYIQPARFHSFDYAEKRSRSYECTSFVETQATALLKEFPVEFVNFNKRQLSRIYPKGTRVDSSNYMPQIFWNAGCQLVALNFQTLDLAMQLNLGTFEYNGRSGYVLKPDFMRRKDRQFDPFAESTVDGIVAGTVHVKIIAGQFLTDRKIGTYVEVDMYGLPADTVRRKFRTKVIPGNGINPVYDEEPFVFRKVVLPNLAILRIAVYSENGTVLLGHRILPVESLRPGYRHISLRNESNQPLGVASLFVHIRVTDYIPDAFADFAAALANPIAYQSQLEKHARQLAILEDFDSENTETSSSDVNDESTSSVADLVTSSRAHSGNSAVPGSSVSNHQQPLSHPAVKRVGSITGRVLSNHDTTALNVADPTVSATAPNQMKTSSLPSSPHHSGVAPSPDPSSKTIPVASAAGSKINVVQTSKLLDPETLEQLTVEELKENKQFAKMAAKFEKDIDLLRRKHEKMRQAKVQQHQAEKDRMAGAHARSRATLERSNAKSNRRQRSSDECSSNDTQQQIAALVASQQQELATLMERHRMEQTSLCCSHYQVELDLELSHGPALRGRLEQLLAAAKEARVARLNRVHDSEVCELKKKLDAQNWEEMKALAKRHRDKNELARVRREATQKHITMAVQERQKLRDLLEQRIAEVQSQYDTLLSSLAISFKQEEELLHSQYEQKCRQLNEDGGIGETAVVQATKDESITEQSLPHQLNQHQQPHNGSDATPCGQNQTSCDEHRQCFD